MSDFLIFSNKNAPVNEAVKNFLSDIDALSKVFVAFSGGLDSTVLLHALVNQSRNSQSNIPLTAIYINHGIQSDSLMWREHCQAFCTLLSVEFVSIDIDLGNYSREGLESKARRLRYQAFENVIKDISKPNSYLLTGHHQKDQAETFLLNLFRGSGVNGLAGMPLIKTIWCANDFSYQHARPLLNVPYDSLKDYALYHQLNYVIDESNSDMRFRRNYVRHKLLPEVESTWPAAQLTLANTATHMQEASILLDKLAQISLKKIVFTCGFIELIDIEKLAWIEQKNIIRFWFKEYWPGVILSSAHYEWVLNAFLNYSNSQNQNYSYQLGKGELRVYQNRLYYLKTLPKSYQQELTLTSRGFEGFNGGVLEKESKEFGFFDFKNNILHSEIKVKLRSIEARDKVNRKQLKKFFQFNNIPVWERAFWPVLELPDKEVLVLGCDKCTLGEAQNLGSNSLQTNAELDKELSVGLSYLQRMKLMQVL